MTLLQPSVARTKTAIRPCPARSVEPADQRNRNIESAIEKLPLKACVLTARGRSNNTPFRSARPESRPSLRDISYCKRGKNTISEAPCNGGDRDRGAA